ncbi:hypothetical protein [Pseudodesulfovibrio pelocollis]|uniref:hypothetical protein n=1 Tax=Pseudodesulfovibrio pelocollis TaxID=3051432 RepID=UPI00255AC1F0|nr:hypothetical protein [Pseudodesulfovibrio sp. SB368]
MGWTHTQRHDFENDEQFIKSWIVGRGFTMHGWSDVPEKGSRGKKGVYYIAVSNDKNPGEVFAVLVLYEWTQDGRLNFLYKVMDETVGPFYYDCPSRILNLLTDTEYPEAITWRKQCRMKSGQALLAFG